jgi:hypothetical protein
VLNAGLDDRLCAVALSVHPDARQVAIGEPQRVVTGAVESVETLVEVRVRVRRDVVEAFENLLECAGYRG